MSKLVGRAICNIIDLYYDEVKKVDDHEYMFYEKSIEGILKGIARFKAEKNVIYLIGAGGEMRTGEIEVTPTASKRIERNIKGDL